VFNAERTTSPPGLPRNGAWSFRAQGRFWSGCHDLMEAGAIDVCNFDASWSGGPTAWRRAAAIALAYDVEMGHHEEPQVSAHLLASQPHGTYAEYFHPDRDPF
jgi:L-alanine-DL-glutamate epimerase-like enolase superfamily enzyme